MYGLRLTFGPIIGIGKNEESRMLRNYIQTAMPHARATDFDRPSGFGAIMEGPQVRFAVECTQGGAYTQHFEGGR